MPTQQAEAPTQNGTSKAKNVDMFDSIEDSIAAFGELFYESQGSAMDCDRGEVFWR